MNRSFRSAPRRSSGRPAIVAMAAAALSAAVAAPQARAADAPRPSFLWISAEDLSAATLGCYGGAAHTPRIDALAAAGLRFDAAFAPSPVCAPSRSGIITGMMPTTLGSLPMRCLATAPPQVVGFPAILRAAGYHCTNKSKTDYNLAAGFDAGWDASGSAAHWRNRARRDQPFFAVVNLGATHESGLFGDASAKVRGRLPAEARRAPADVRVPPYYPATPTIAATLAARLELAAALDADVGRILDQLEADGLADDTIVVFWSDHGEGIPHGKRALTEHGLRVPLVVRVPAKFAAGARLPGGADPRGVSANLVSLLDLGPTMLDLAGLEPPAWMEGRSFLGPHAVGRESVIAARDRMDAMPGFGRSVRTARARYVRSFMPWLPGDDLPPYADGVPITGELRALRDAGRLPPEAAWFSRAARPVEELYDVAADPDELRDLASLADRRAELEAARGILREWMRSTRDTGILPEAILRREARAAGSEWAIFHPRADDAAALSRYDAILDAAWTAGEGGPIARFTAGLAAADAAVRFWAACGTGWAALAPGAVDPPAAAAAALAPFLADPEPTVRIAAARWICACVPEAEGGPARDVLLAGCREADPEVRLAALVAVDQLGDRAAALWPEAVAVEPEPDDNRARSIQGRIRARLEKRGPPHADPPPAAGPTRPGRWIDLTHAFDAGTIYWPTEEGFRFLPGANGPRPGIAYYAANRFASAEHGGTHVDAPRHFAARGHAADEIELDRLLGAAVVVDVSRRCAADPVYEVSPDDLVAWERRQGRQLVDVIVLLRTGWAARWEDRTAYLGTAKTGPEAVKELRFPGLSPDAARWLVEHRRVRAVGIDTASIDHGPSSAFGAHVALCGADVPVFENLAALDALPETGAFVAALPMKIAGGSGGPLRIVAHVPAGQ